MVRSRHSRHRNVRRSAALRRKERETLYVVEQTAAYVMTRVSLASKRNLRRQFRHVADITSGTAHNRPSLELAHGDAQNGCRTKQAYFAYIVYGHSVISKLWAPNIKNRSRSCETVSVMTELWARRPGIDSR
jgi:hypothetical protein